MAGQINTLRAAADRVGNGQLGTKQWFSAAELAELALPGLPTEKRSITRRANDERWRLRLDEQTGEPLARPRPGRGGGEEFHVSLLPGAARIELAKRGISCEQPAASAPAACGWPWYERQPGKTKREAERRAAIISEVDLLTASGVTKSAAVADVAARHGTSKATLWNWLEAVEGVAATDRLPALAPRYRGGGKQAEIDGSLWTIFLSDYLRPSAPTLKACYDRTRDIAVERGITIPSDAAFRRKLKREIEKPLLVLRREGMDALRRSVPSQRRTVEGLHALDIVNIDGHVFDVWVVPPGGGDPVRPIIVGTQDIYSSKLLSWCIDLTENSIQTQIAFRNLFQEYGLPRVVQLDNGRAFASKKITGGAKTRFRFKIKEDEPTGVLTALGIETVWALPYRGQSKPIERAWRDVCERISKHPAMEGAYAGNSPVNKPDNYGTRAIEWEEFIAHVERGIARHNAQQGRRGRHYQGRSFDQVFAESYAVAPIRKAGPEQLRMALLTAEYKRVDRNTGEISLFGNRYYTIEMAQLCGQKVLVRFDPENLHSEVHLFDTDGRFLLTAPLLDDTGYQSEAGAKSTAKRFADVRKATKRAEEMHQLLEADMVAAAQARPPLVEMPEPTVFRPQRHRGQTAAALKPQVMVEETRPNRSFNLLRIIGGNE